MSRTWPFAPPNSLSSFCACFFETFSVDMTSPTSIVPSPSVSRAWIISAMAVCFALASSASALTCEGTFLARRTARLRRHVTVENEW